MLSHLSLQHQVVAPSRKRVGSNKAEARRSVSKAFVANGHMTQRKKHMSTLAPYPPSCGPAVLTCLSRIVNAAARAPRELSILTRSLLASSFSVAMFFTIWSCAACSTLGYVSRDGTSGTRECRNHGGFTGGNVSITSGEEENIYFFLDAWYGVIVELTGLACSITHLRRRM